MAARLERLHVIAIFLLTVPLSFAWAAEAGQISKPEDLVAKHLEALGSADARAAAKNRLAQGTAQYTIVVGGAGTLDGSSTIVSDGDKYLLLMKFPNNTYRGEQIVTNGDKVNVAFTSPQHTRSPFGEFVRVQDAVIKEGLLCGELSTAWALLHTDQRKPKLKLKGIDTVDGVKVYDLLYAPKKGSDLEIHLYFDATTFRHVASLYKVSINPGVAMGAPDAGAADLPGAPAHGLSAPGETSETATARQQLTRYRLDEKFSDFKTVDGLTLPSSYTLHFTFETAKGSTQVTEWHVVVNELSNNVQLDPRNFEAK
jgi:hypothetical protein